MISFKQLGSHMRDGIGIEITILWPLLSLCLNWARMKLNYTLALFANYVGGALIQPALNLLPLVLFDYKNYNCRF